MYVVASAPMLRIGHRGAAALAPENTIAGVRAALAAGVDGIEFDVCPGLVVAHDRGRPGPALAGFLADLGGLAPAGTVLIVDLKTAGYEREVLAACRAAGVAEQCVFSTERFDALAVLNDVARTSATLSAGRAWLPLGRRTPAVAMYHRSGARDATVRHDAITPGAGRGRPRARRQGVRMDGEQPCRHRADACARRRRRDHGRPQALPRRAWRGPVCLPRSAASCAIVGNRTRRTSVLSRRTR